jgi:hypothetical protein
MSEDTNNLPDVDFSALRNMVSEGQEKEEKAEPDTTKTASQVAEAEEFDLGQFKNPKDVLKGYKEIQAFSTKIAQENKELKSQLQSIMEQVELMRYQQPSQPPPQHAGNWDFDKAFIENAGGAVAAVAKGVSEATIQQALRTSMIEEVLYEEEAKDKNPDKSEFKERYAFAMQLRNQYPNLINSKGGVRKLFELADKTREQYNRGVAERTIKTLVGEDVDLEKFRAMVKKDGGQDNSRAKQMAFMPETSGSFRSGSDSGASNVDRAITDAVGKGDVDTVIQGLFHKALKDTG